MFNACGRNNYDSCPNDNRARMRAAKCNASTKIVYKEKVSLRIKNQLNFFSCTKSLNSKEWSLIANQDLREKALKQKY